MYLGIDLGTSASKAVLVDRAGRVLSRSRAPHTDSRSHSPGRVDVRAWERSVREACHRLDTTGVTAVGLAVHGPAVVLLDAEGRPLGSGVCWDHPALPELCEQLESRLTDGERALIGNRVSPSTFTALAWRFFVKHEPELAERAHTLGLVGTWLGQLLTGQVGLDPTQAAYTGMFASTDGTWAWLADVAEKAGVPQEVLPPIRPSLSVLGPLLPRAADDLGLPAGVPVVVGAGDTAAAAYMLGVREGGPPLYTVGTTHVITRCTTAADPAPDVIQRAHVLPGHWLWHGAVNGGDALAVAARVLGYGESGDAVRDMVDDAGRATPAQAAKAPVFIPHVSPERGPLWLERPHTALVGLVSATDARSAAWGAVEGVAFTARMILETCAGTSTTPPVMTGTFGADPVYPQIVADVLGTAVDLVDESHLPAMGAAALAAATVDGVSATVPPARRVSPREGWHQTVHDRWLLFRDTWERLLSRPFPPRLL
jgi:xylulokinase